MLPGTTEGAYTGSEKACNEAQTSGHCTPVLATCYMTDDEGVTCAANHQEPLQATAAVVNDDLSLCQPLLLHWPDRFDVCMTLILRPLQQADYYCPINQSTNSTFHTFRTDQRSQQTMPMEISKNAEFE